MSSKTFNLSAFLPYRMAVLSERVSRRLSVEYERTHGLSSAEWRVLVHLMRCREVSVREIHNCVNLEKPRVSRAVARLEDMGLVKKEQSKDDGRLLTISLTSVGLDALSEILPAVKAIEAQIIAGLSPNELKSFLGIMEKIHKVLDDDPEARPRSRMDTDIRTARAAKQCY